MINHRLVAAGVSSLFKAKTDPVSGVDSTQLDVGQVATELFYKFLNVLEAAVIIIIGLIIVRYLKRYFAKIETTHERQKTAINLLEKITSGFLLVMSVTIALEVIGLDITLIIGVLSLGLSFGLRDVIKNYVAGLLILFKSPFEIGDVVKIRNFTGRVEKIEFQAITILTFDKKEITIHNSDLLTQPIINFSKAQHARLKIDLTVGYGSDLHRTLRVFEAILESNPAVLKSPKYSIVFQDFGHAGVNVRIRFWVQKPCNVLKIRSDLAMQLQEVFDEETILAPFTREVDFESGYIINEARKNRLKSFYGQPMLAAIAMQTNGQVAVAAANGNGTNGNGSNGNGMEPLVAVPVAVAVGEAPALATSVVATVSSDEYDNEEPEE